MQYHTLLVLYVVDCNKIIVDVVMVYVLQLIRYLRVYEPNSGFEVTSSDRYSQDKEGAGAKLVVTRKW